MCWEDVQIGRRSKPEWDVATVGAAFTVVVPPDSHRLNLIFSVPANVLVLIWPDNTVSATKGIALQPGNPPFRLNLADDGALVTGAWFAVAPGGNTQLCINASYLGDKPQ